jgi:hypothetical protein
VLVETDPDDIHVEYVRNQAGWHAPILYGRYVPGVTDVSRVRQAFPDRACHLYRVSNEQLVRLDNPVPSSASPTPVTDGPASAAAVNMVGR